MSEELPNSMKKSLEAAQKVSIKVTRPGIANVAASINPGAAKQAAKQPEPIQDEFDTDVAFRFAFIGSGQGGARIADAFWRMGYRRCCAFNTTESDFDGLSAAMPKFSLEVGGAGKDTTAAKDALRGREEDVRDLLLRSWSTELDYGIVCASLGGGTGSGTAPELVKIARRYMEDRGIPPRVGVIISLPPVGEGYQICRNAVQGFRELLELKVSPMIIIDNDRIHKLYKPAMAQLHATANNTVAQLLHLFNQLAAVHSPYITFDRSELGQILDGGLMTMGAADINKIDSPADVSSAIRENLCNTVLAEVDLSSGRKAACLFVGAEDILNKLDLEYFDAGYTAMDRVLQQHDPNAATVVHRGLYPGTEPGLQAYVAVGELDTPRKRLLELARKGGLMQPGSSGGTAAFLGVQDG